MENKNYLKRIVAVLMAIMMMLSTMSVMAFATDSTVCEHIWNDGETVTEATCTSAGEMKYTCTSCGEEKTEETEKKPHEAVTVTETPSTCIATGLSEGKYCSVCNEVLIAQTELPLADHSYDDGTVVEDATCTTAGSMLFTCSVCDDEKTEEIPVSEHNYDYENGVETVAPTCTSAGEMTYTCKDCSATKAEEIPMSEHSEVIDEAIDATCSATGLTEGSHCSVCNTVIVSQEVVDKVPHTESVISEISATCTQPGMTEKITCSVCNAVIKAAELIEPTGHKFDEQIIDADHIATEATCIKIGAYYYDCANCDVMGTETYEYGSVNTLNHTNTELIAKLDATCTASGYEEYTYCHDCKTELNKVEIDALNHNFQCVKVVQPTCTEKGYSVYVCANDSSHSYNDNYVDALGHTPETDEKIEPTCITLGYEEGSHCSVCNEVIVEQAEIAMLEHSYTGEIKANDNDTHSNKCVNGCEEYGNETTCSDENSDCVCDVCGDAIAHKEVIDSKVEPTCTETGLEEGKHCEVCGTVTVEQTVISALEHDYPEWNTTLEPTCTEKGSKERTCQRENCGNIETEEIEANGHVETFINGSEPTCTTSGTADAKYCNVCQTVYEGGQFLLPLGHEPVVDPAVPATCITTGLTRGEHCGRENCGAVLTAQEVVEVLEHKYDGAVKVEENDTHSFMCIQGCEEYGEPVDCVDEDKNCICDICGDAVEHKIVVEEEIPAKCLETGMSEGRYCEVCGEVFLEKYVLEATGHSPVVDEKVDATCISTGLSSGIHCEWCGLVIVAQTVTEKTGHEKVIDERTEPTCTEVGYDYGVHCGYCGEVIQEQAVIDALGHNEDGILPEEAATCTTSGKSEGKFCTRCNTVVVEQVFSEALDHIYTEIEYIAPTCTTEGREAGTYCSRCEKTLMGGGTLPALEHSFSENWTIDRDVTCTVDGEKSHHCKNSGCTERIDITAIVAEGHKEEIIPKVNATCTETGLEEGKKCSVCDEILLEQTVIDATGHAYETDWATVTEATCTQEGEKNNLCVNCNETISIVIEKLEHTPVTDAKIEATCVSVGYEEGSHCGVCEEVLVAQAETAMLEHSYTGDVKAENDDTHSYKCVNGCEEYGNTEDCIDENADCVCDKCGDGIAHIEVIDEAKTETCISTGLTEGSHCEVCGEVIVAQEEIPMLEHSYTGEVQVLDNDTHSLKCVNGCDLYGEAVGCVDGDSNCVCDVCGDAISHKFDDSAWETTVEATCTVVGSRNNNCVVCQQNIVEEIPALEHSYTGEIQINEDDTHAIKCVNGCEQFSEAVACSDEDSNCVCDICSDAIAHKVVIDEAKVETCIAIGLTEGSHCEVCGEVIVAQEEIPMLEHSYTGEIQINENDTHAVKCVNGCDLYNEAVTCEDTDSDCVCDVCGDGVAHKFETEWRETLAPTCVVEGAKTNNCVVCLQTITESIPVIEHSYTGEIKTEDGYKHSYKCVNGCEEYGNVADCSDEGEKDCICDVCAGAMAHTEVVDAAKAATCTETGLTEGKHCEVCGAVILAREVTEALGHALGEWETVKSALCTEKGSQSRKCAACDYSETEEIKALGHAYSDKWTTDKAATCTAKGSKSKHCTREGCDAKTSVTAIKATGHDYVATVTKKATYTSTGVTTYTCSACGAKYTKTIAKLKLGKVTGIKVSSTKKTTVTLKWNKVTGAEKYRIYQYIDGEWQWIKTTSSTSYTVKKLKSGTDYKFRVRAIVEGDKGPYSDIVSAKTKLSTPSASLKAGSKKITVSWAKIRGASGYEIQYSTSSKMKNAKTTTVNSGSTKSKTIKKLKKGKRYYIRVRAYTTVNGVKVYSSWSSIKNIKAK